MKDIAIIGVAGRFPDARNIQELYENLKNAHCSARRLSQERKKATNLHPGRTYKTFSFLEDIDLFDHKFFKLSMAEAQCMDPHQRMLLEVVYEAFESAGINPDELWGSNTAVFCGDVSLKYYELAQEYDPTLLTGNLNTVTSSRISRFFNFRGNNLMVDTNCSSTLVAAHLACQELIHGDADQALVCGVRLILRPEEEDHTKDEVGIMAHDGKTRSFSAAADGTGAGEAASSILLKPLDQALEDGDPIYGVIKATAVNQEAMLSGSLTAPSSQAQAEVILKAINKAGIEAESISFIEPHGSGTKLGDPIEIQGIDQAFKEAKRSGKHEIAVSAIKSNIGHTDTVAGLSGLVKVLLSLENKELFPSLHFDEANPFIDFDNSICYINTELSPWERKGNFPLRAGLSSFGLSGTNCHIILEEAPQKEHAVTETKHHFLSLSAHTKEALLRNVQNLRQFLLQRPETQLGDLAQTLNKGRKHFPYRISFIEETTEDFTEQLSEVDSKAISFNRQANKKLIFIFPDRSEGASRLIRILSEKHPSFADDVTSCQQFHPGKDEGCYEDFVLQYSLYRLLERKGIQTKQLLGIGVGKVSIDAILAKKSLKESVETACAFHYQKIVDFDKRLQHLIDRESEQEKALFVEFAEKSTFSEHLDRVQTGDYEDFFNWFSFHSDHVAPVLQVLKGLYQDHFPINWKHAENEGDKIWLPPYSFEPIRCWLREPSPDVEDSSADTEEESSSPSQQLEESSKVNFVSSAHIDDQWTDTQQQIAQFWVEILKLDEISLDDDFFKLGGHSLLATQLISRIEKKYHVRLDFKNIARFSSIRSLAEGVEELLQKAPSSVPAVHAIEATAPQEHYPLSKAQSRQWLLHQLEEDSTAYNLPAALRMKGNLNVEQLKNAFQKLMEVHESLRTSFQLIDGEPRQFITSSYEFPFTFEKDSETDESKLISDFIRPFDLEQAPPFRVKIIERAQEEYLLLFDIHHIVSDGVSSEIIMRDFLKAYRGTTLETGEVSYKDFAVWQNKLFEQGLMKDQEDFWIKRFEGEIPVLNLTTDFERPAIRTQEGGRTHYSFSKELSEQLQELAQKNGATMYMCLMALFQALLHKYTDDEDIVTGSPNAGRSRQELESIVGMFVNTMAMRNFPRADISFEEFLLQVQDRTLEVFEHQDYPFEMLVDQLQIERNLSRNPLFDVMFSYQKFYQQGQESSMEELEISGVPFDNPSAKFDLSLEVTEGQGQLHFHLEYAADLYQKETAEGILRHLETLAYSVVKNPEILLGEIQIAGRKDQEMVNSFNQTFKPYDLNKNFLDFWNEALARYPENIAISYQKEQLSYQEVDLRAEKLALHLINLGIKSGDVVAIQLPPSEWMFISILACFKVGAIFLPMDQQTPPLRKQHLLDESESRLMLSLESSLPYLPDHCQELILGKQTLSEITVPEDIQLPERPLKGDSGAYIIYTSGTSGNPKGVLVSHRSLSNLIQWYREQYELKATDKILKYSSFAFDASILDFFPGLSVGAGIYLVEEEARKDLNLLHQFLTVEKINVAFLPTSMAELYMEFENPYLEKLLIGGSSWNGKLPKNISVFNNYGPTENTVITSCSMKALNQETLAHSIGKPIANNEVQIWQPGSQIMCPLGIPGEIVISGESLALGYWKNEELSAQVFVDDAQVPGKKWYRSGDLGRYNYQGEIEFYGRIDEQVKINGYRIEPEETTQVLLKQEAIKNAYVAALNIQGEKQLVAYVVPKAEIDLHQLEDQLRLELPEYMIPAHWKLLDEIPLNERSKVATDQLPGASDFEETREEIIEARTDLEKQLVGLAKEILNREEIGINQNFFRIGGHSLRATRFLAKIRSELGLELSLKSFFQAPSIEAIARQLEGNQLSNEFSLPTATKKPRYQASSAQTRLHFLQQLNPESIAYNIPGALHLKQKIDESRLQESLEALLILHPGLKTRFVQEDGIVYQEIVEQAELKIEHSHATLEGIQAELEKHVQAFDLNTAPLLRIRLIDLESDGQVLFFDIHHSICDGSSMMILMSDFMKLYGGQQIETPEAQFIDYSEWLSSEQGIEELNRQKSYWTEQFSGEIPQLELPYDFKRPELSKHEGKRLYSHIEREQLDQIQALNEAHGSTNFMFFLACFQLFLHKHSGSKDICIGTPVAGRGHAELQNVIGMFVNTLVLRQKLDSNQTFSDFLKEVKESSLEALQNQDFPYEELLEEINVPRNTGRNPLFDVFFIYQNLERATSQSNGDQELHAEPINFETSVSKFDLSLEIQENGDEFQVIFEYASKLFRDESIALFLQRWKALLNQVIENPEIKISEIDCMSPEEKNYLLHEYNQSESPYPDHQTLADLFEEQVKKTPDAIAIKHVNQEFSYRKLNEDSNRLAHQLLDKYGVQSEELVAICLDRSYEMIVSIFGILKAGAAYLPIDPDAPESRISFILEDSQSSICLTNKLIREQIPSSCQILEPSLLIAEGQNTDNPELPRTSDHLAYVIYTSGSTGQPKGTLLKHQGVVNRVFWMHQHMGIGERDTILQKTAYVFDVSIWEFFNGLCYGTKLILCDKEDIANPARIVELIETEKITAIHFVPGMLNSFLAHLDSLEVKKLHSLQQVFASGEALHPETVRSFHSLIDAKLYNLYGPTEASVEVSYYRTEGNEELVPIGKPISNVQLYLLDEQMNPVPQGVPGELYIGGPCLAVGYLNRSELTAKNFVKHPFETGQRLYKSGDLARMDWNGQIHYLGRLDFQVKIRGYRIELGEIEQQLLKLPEVKEAAIIAQDDPSGDSYLTAYVVSEENQDEEVFHQKLSKQLPEYMIPTVWVFLDRLPVNASGKLDRKALPQANPGIRKSSQTIRLPENETQKILVDLWKSMLPVQEISTEDNFFEIGGHSLKASILVARIQKEFGVQISLLDLFKKPSILELEFLIDSSKESVYNSIIPLEKREFYPASSAQKRLFVLSRINRENTQYNMPYAFEIIGDLDQERMKKALKALVKRHEALRTSFGLEGTQIVQYVHETVELPVLLHQRDQIQQVTNLIQELILPFNLEEAPLARLHLCQTPEQTIAFFDMHHALSDGLSMQILYRDFAALYMGEVLPDVYLQYRDYAIWQQENAGKDFQERQSEFWLEHLSGELPGLNLPLDFNRPAIQSYDGDTVYASLDEDISSQLRAFALEKQTTSYMVLFAVFNVLMAKYSGQEDLVIGTPVAGRPHPDLHQLIGMFVNTLPVRNYPKQALHFDEFLKELTERTLGCFDHQEYPFEELVDQLVQERDMSRNPIFDILFSYQNLEEGAESEFPLQFKPFGVQVFTSKFDLQLDILDFGDHLQSSITFCTKLFKKETAARFLSQVQLVLEQVLQNPDCKLGDLDLNTKEEKEQLKQWHQELPIQAPTGSIVQLFEQQCNNFGDRNALVSGEFNATYQQLNELANQLAHQILEAEISSGSVIGISCARNEWIVIAQLAILKAGASYLPLVPDLPSDRISFMMEDSDMKMVLTDHNLDDDCWQKIPRIKLNYEELSTQSIENPETIIQATDRAYIIYTSGSTGQPKGVQVAHAQVLNLVSGLNKAIYSELEAHRNVALIASYAFDASVQQIYGALLQGHCLHIISSEHREQIANYLEYCRENQIHVSDGTPSFLQLIVAQKQKLEADFPTSQFIIGGEALGNETVAHFLDLFTQAPKLTNVYGPTECCVDSSYYHVNRQDLEYHTIMPIGRALEGQLLYVMDKNLKEQSTGVPGELCIAGANVSLGYLNRDELQQEKFVRHPENGLLLYRSGDLVRRDQDGKLHFLGRMDQQVKIRGYRIELGEIEAQLLGIDEIQQVAVVPFKNEQGTAYLCAYLVAEKELEISSVRALLSSSLPSYMVPSYFVQLEEIPRNESGKIDRKALPKPDVTHLGQSQFEAPESEEEKIMAACWEKLLGIERVGRNDHFFNLGGDSIKAIQLNALLLTQNYRLNLSELFQTPTLKDIAQKLNDSKLIIPQTTAVGEVPLTPIQHHFFGEQYPKANHFNQSVLLESWEHLDQDILKLCIQALSVHHDILRSRYQQNEAGISQHLLDPDEFTHEVYTFTSLENEADFDQIFSTKVEKSQESLDIFKGPLWRVDHYSREQGDLIHIIVHHLIMDGVSWRILIEDLIQAYQQMKAIGTVSLPEKTHSYQYWSQSIQEYAQTPKLKKELDYWKQILCNEGTSLSTKAQISLSPTVKENSFTLGEEQTNQLLTRAIARYGCEINDLLLSALGRAIYRWKGHKELMIHLEGHGREPINEELELSRTVGWFTSIYPCLIQGYSEDLGELIELNRKHLSGIPNKGIGYGICRYILSPEDVAWEKDVPEVLFNYLGQIGNKSDQLENSNEEEQLLGLSSLNNGRDIALENEGKYPWTITGIVANGKLNLRLSYREDLFNASEIEVVLEQYQEALNEMISEAETTEALSEGEIERVKNLEQMIRQPMRLLHGRGSEDKIFFFPPAIGFAMVYQDLASELEGFEVYGINFLEAENRRETYLREMVAINGNRDFVLAGYSGGANLAYQMAAYLIEQGYVVSDIIMLDGMRTTEAAQLPEESLNEKVQQYISEEEGHISHELLPSKMERDRVRKIVASYQNYLHLTADDQELPVNVHQLLSEQQWEEGNLKKQSWKEIIQGELINYQGVGEHGSMMNPENLETNGKLFREILQQIKLRKYQKN
ncbi:MAG: amino acid adenylation domain-containing protein [Bacteroidetes bacterium]|nr:MAG: amino acid adenylation domain-containing protein [Bacteroidota bacterium]